MSYRKKTLTAVAVPAIMIAGVAIVIETVNPAQATDTAPPANSAEVHDKANFIFGSLNQNVIQTAVTKAVETRQQQISDAVAQEQALAAQAAQEQTLAAQAAQEQAEESYRAEVAAALEEQATQQQSAQQESAPAESSSNNQNYSSSGGGSSDASSWASGSKPMSVKMCESGNNYSTNTGNGYYGAWQFDIPSWLANGGGQYASRPDLATPEQQDQIAYNYYQSAGWGPWACG